MTLKLRLYQEECLKSIHDHFEKGIIRQLVNLPVAAGKTVIFANLIQQLNRKTLVLAHTRELLSQARDKIIMINPDIDVGLVNADSKEFDKPVVVSTIQSARQPGTLAELQKQNFELCIFDECHRSAADSPREVLKALGFLDSKEKLLCGFTATAFRNDARGLGEIFQEVVFHRSVKDLIDLGYLCPPRGIRIANDLDLSGVKTEDGDFSTSSLASVMDTTEMNELVANSFIDKAADRSAVCFSVTVDHARNLAEAFKQRGIIAESVSGGMDLDERENILERFKSGKIQVLTNCQLLVEGWDVPQINCVVVAKPTKSKSLFIQMCGRGLRLFPNKHDCLILDFNDRNHSLCSLPDLVDDAESAKHHEKKVEGKISEFAKHLPPTLNKKLRSAIIEFDLLGENFTWFRDENSYYSLKGNGDRTLKIFPTAAGQFSALLFKGNELEKIVARDLSFEYAFASADEYAKSHRELFTLCDLNASWRDLPISDKQKGLFRSYGFRSGIEALSRGQAALIIGSGVLNRKTARR